VTRKAVQKAKAGGRVSKATSPAARKRAPQRATPAAPARAGKAPRGAINERAARQRATTATGHAAPPARKRERRPTRPLPAGPATPPSNEAENEEPLVETPTSFNVDIRRTRSRTATLEERIVADPNSAEALAAGDVEVTQESAASVGDETPGGDNPTPDMDIVDLIGRSLGVEYEDNEELKGVDKIAERDRKRWELDPASSEDYKDRNRG
jgi:hypothetical protein